MTNIIELEKEFDEVSAKIKAYWKQERTAAINTKNKISTRRKNKKENEVWLFLTKVSTRILVGWKQKSVTGAVTAIYDRLYALFGEPSFDSFGRVSLYDLLATPNVNDQLLGALVYEVLGRKLQLAKASMLTIWKTPEGMAKYRKSSSDLESRINERKFENEFDFLHLFSTLRKTMLQSIEAQTEIKHFFGLQVKPKITSATVKEEITKTHEVITT